jgi:hypothetical protein
MMISEGEAPKLMLDVYLLKGVDYLEFIRNSWCDKGWIFLVFASKGCALLFCRRDANPAMSRNEAK